MAVSLAAIAALGSIASAVGGGIMSAQANAEAQAKLAADAEEDRRYYSRLLNRDYVNSSENQSLLRRLQELQRKNYERARATNIVAGGTDASLAAMQQSGNQVVTDTAQGIAARSDAYKERVGAAKRASEKTHAQQMFALGQQKAQTIAQAAGQATSAFAGLAAAGGSAYNPFDTKAGEVAAPTGAAAVTPAPTISNPQIAAAVNDLDLQKAIATVPSAMNGYQPQFTPSEYDAWMRTRQDAQNIFGLIK